MPKNADFMHTLGELDAGILASKLSNVLGDVSLGVIQHGKKGKITLTLDLDQIGESAQINLSHKISYVKPTLRGKVSEEDTTATPMYVNTKGSLTVSPETQDDIFKAAGEKA